MEMPRYFLHLKKGARLVRDHEGSVLASAEEAHAEAVQAAREICAEAIKRGEGVPADAVIIVDETGAQVAFLPITESLSVLLRGTVSIQNQRNYSDTLFNLMREYENACYVKGRVDRLHAEIDQQVCACRLSIGDIRKQLSAI
jgi:hypothetical protein